MNEPQVQPKHDSGVSRKTIGMIVGVLLLGQLVITIIVGTYFVNNASSNYANQGGAWGGKTTVATQVKPNTGGVGGGSGAMVQQMMNQVGSADGVLEEYANDVTMEEVNPYVLRQEIRTPGMNNR